MLRLSQRLNPECEHRQGDMRSVRLGRTFDAVLVQDAVLYLTTEDDLRLAMATAFEHCRPGGVALFAPDCVRETFAPATSTAATTAPGGRCGTWPGSATRTRRTRPTSWTSRTSCACRDGSVRVEHDRHECGLFPRADWLELLEEAGFDASPVSLASDWSPVGSEGYVGIRRS